MEYRNTFLLPNQYPNFANYDKNLNGDIVLTGIYEENFITFNIPSLDEIEVVEDTTFRFILEVKETNISDEVRYFTSPSFYEDLVVANAESNPYHIQTALDPELFVKITLDKQIEIFNQLKLIDFGTGVKQNQNLFLAADNSIDYVVLVQYVDWLVGKVDPLDNDNNGVIPAEKIADFEIGKYDPNTGEFISVQEQALNLQNRIDTLESELEEVDAAIQAITGDLPAEPQKRKTSVLEVISLGLGAISVAQGAAAAIKGGAAAFGAAANVTKKAVAEPIRTIGSTAKTIPPLNPPALKAPDFSKIFPGYAPPTSVASTVAKSTSKTLAQFAKSTIKAGKNLASTVGKTTTKVVAASTKFLAKQANTEIGRALVNAGAATAAQAAAGGLIDKSAAKKQQTDIILKSVAKSAAVEVGKVLVKKAITKAIIKGAAAKVLGAAAGPIGAGIMAAVGIVKFFVNKKKEKKEFEKQKKEYDRVMGELERLTKRKEDIEAEIAGIIKSGKLKLAREFDERFSSTQKYFANIGKSILEKQQTTLVSPLGG